MSEPIVFVVRNRVKPGMFDAFAKHYRDSVLRTEAGKHRPPTPPG